MAFLGYQSRALDASLSRRCPGDIWSRALPPEVRSSNALSSSTLQLEEKALPSSVLSPHLVHFRLDEVPRQSVVADEELLTERRLIAVWIGEQLSTANLGGLCPGHLGEVAHQNAGDHAGKWAESYLIMIKWPTGLFRLPTQLNSLERVDE